MRYIKSNITPILLGLSLGMFLFKVLDLIKEIILSIELINH